MDHLFDFWLPVVDIFPTHPLSCGWNPRTIWPPMARLSCKQCYGVKKGTKIKNVEENMQINASCSPQIHFWIPAVSYRVRQSPGCHKLSGRGLSMHLTQWNWDYLTQKGPHFSWLNDWLHQTQNGHDRKHSLMYNNHRCFFISVDRAWGRSVELVCDNLVFVFWGWAHPNPHRFLQIRILKKAGLLAAS